METSNMARSNGAVTEKRLFGAVVRDLLIERGVVTPMGNPNWAAFAQGLIDPETSKPIQYESLRKAVTGERRPSAKIMEAVAAALEVEPTTFYEYLLWQAQRSFDPAEVGEDEAFANLQAWIKATR